MTHSINSQLKPSILQVAPIDSYQVSGLAHSVPGLLCGLHRLGVPVGLLTTSPRGPHSQPQPYPVGYCNFTSCLTSSFPSLLTSLVNPDLLVFHSTYIPLHAILAFEARRQKIPYVITPRGGMTRGAQQSKRWKKWIGNTLFFRRMVRQAAAIHCLSGKEAADARAWNRPVFVVSNGVELPSTQALSRPAEKRELQLVFVGRFDMHHKGLDLLLRACVLAEEDLRQAMVKVNLYGSGTAENRMVIRRIINDHCIGDFVHLHDPVFGQAKEEVFRNADLFLHTSRFEGQPMAVLEALSYGVPCLLTPGTNMASEVRMSNAGWEVAAHPEAIANRLCMIVSARSELVTRGLAARKLIQRKYTWDQVARQLLDEYLKLLHLPLIH